MPSMTIAKVVLNELITLRRSPRVMEPDLVMDDPAKVAAYTRAGREDGVMAPVYLYHCTQISDILRPGDTVVDLGCGPATQLAMVARLNPQTNFIGVDLSEEMLARARDYITDSNLGNVSLQKGDITRLDFLADQSVDAVCSTVVLHHLPTVEHLKRTFAQIARVLKPGGGVYLVDFGHLRSDRSINYFAYQYSDRQAELFTLDYLYSLRAAFWVSDFRAATAQYLRGRARLYVFPLLPYMMAVKSPSRRHDEVGELKQSIGELKAAMPPYHQKDLQDLETLFKLGGLKNPLLH